MTLRSTWRHLGRLGLLWLGACAAPAPTPPAAAPEPSRAPTRPGAPPPELPEPAAPPELAHALGWMPLASTGVPGFLDRHPRYDGRGVLIAILDGGVDPGVPGLTRLPDGSRKLVDVADFSGEGRIVLSPARIDGARIRFGSVILEGASRVRALRAGGPVLGGVLDEGRLGEPPAADLNGNGVVGDSLAVIVFRLSDGWALLADTDGDGSLAGETPVRDFTLAGDTFGWRTAGAPSPVTIAARFEDRGAATAPGLDLVFDTSGHGTHVAGIAAGAGLYGVSDFGGVAPAAELLGIKFANNARGGITVSGSMLRAMDHAIRFARGRRQPLVINMSFGVGNEREGNARIDVIVDSVLAANPDVVLVASAGNDGPGLSTVGFPASARRVVTVGATYPGVFLPPREDGSRWEDMIAFFSARGGELDAPDLVAPGLAFSTVPRFDRGEEVKHGTSMAAPHVAGLAALLISGLRAEGRSIDGAMIRRALIASARPLPWGTVLDQGAGQPDVLRAWELLAEGPGIEVGVEAVGSGVTGAWHVVTDGSPAVTSQRFRLGRQRPGAPATWSLSSDAPWLEAPPTVRLADTATVTVRYRSEHLRRPGVHVGVVHGLGPDSALGPGFRLVSTVIVPRPMPDRPDSIRSSIEAGAFHRIVLPAEAGRPFRVRVLEPRGAPLLAFLHEPGGRPWRGGHAALVTDEEDAVTFDVDGRDVEGGLHELVLVAGPAEPVDPLVIFDPAPAPMDLGRIADQVVVPAGPGERDVTLIGGERTIDLASRGASDLVIPFDLPVWAGRVVIQLELERAQWPRFTDFGLTLLDGAGRQLATSPMNYHVGRLTRALPSGRTATRGLIVLSPGFADPGAREEWPARLAIRLYADAQVPIAGRGMSSGRELRPLPPLPWALPEGFVPLARLTVRQGDRSWTREAALSEDF